MTLPWNKSNPIQDQCDELAVLIFNEANSEKREALIKEWMELDERLMEHKKLNRFWIPSPDTVINAGATLAIALWTLTYEREDVLTSKVANLFLRRQKN